LQRNYMSRNFDLVMARKHLEKIHGGLNYIENGLAESGLSLRIAETSIKILNDGGHEPLVTPPSLLEEIGYRRRGEGGKPGRRYPNFLLF